MGSTTVKETRDEKQTLDPATEARLQENYDHSRAVTDIPYKPFTGQRVAGYSPESTAAQERLLGLSTSNSGKAAYDQAAGIFSDLGSYKPSQVRPGTATAINVDPTLLKGVDVKSYMNPYEDEVVSRTLADIARQRDIQRVKDSQYATMSKAFGDTRHGVADSLTNEAYDRNMLDTAASLRSSGFDRAMGYASGDVDRQNQAGVFNATNRMDTERFNISNDYDAQNRNVANDMASAEFRANMANMIKGMSDADLARQLQEIGLQDTVGMGRQAMEQAFNDAAFEAYQMEYQDVYNRLNARNTALGMFPALVNTNSTSTRTENKGPMGIISPLLGAAGMALGGPLGGMLGGSLFGTAAAGAGGAIGSGISSAARYVR